MAIRNLDRPEGEVSEGEEMGSSSFGCEGVGGEERAHWYKLKAWGKGILVSWNSKGGKAFATRTRRKEAKDREGGRRLELTSYSHR